MQEKLKTSETATKITEAASETLVRLFGLPVGQRVEVENWEQVLTKEFERIVETCNEWGVYLDFKDWDEKINVFPPSDFDASKSDPVNRPREYWFLRHCASMMQKIYDKRSEVFGLDLGKNLAVGLVEIKEKRDEEEAEKMREWEIIKERLSPEELCKHEVKMLMMEVSRSKKSEISKKNDVEIAKNYFDTKTTIPKTSDVWSFFMKKGVLDGFGQHLKHDFNTKVSGSKDPFAFTSKEYDWRETSIRCLIDYMTTESRKEKANDFVGDGETEASVQRRSFASR